MLMSPWHSATRPSPGIVRRNRPSARTSTRSLAHPNVGIRASIASSSREIPSAAVAGGPRNCRPSASQSSEWIAATVDVNAAKLGDAAKPMCGASTHSITINGAPSGSTVVSEAIIRGTGTPECANAEITRPSRTTSYGSKMPRSRCIRRQTARGPSPSNSTLQVIFEAPPSTGMIDTTRAPENPGNRLSHGSKSMGSGIIARNSPGPRQRCRTPFGATIAPWNTPRPSNSSSP